MTIRMNREPGHRRFVSDRQVWVQCTNWPVHELDRRRARRETGRPEVRSSGWQAVCRGRAGASCCRKQRTLIVVGDHVEKLLVITGVS